MVPATVTVNHAEMNFIEAGKRIPNVYIALKIAKALKTTVEGLFPLLDNEIKR